MEHRIHKHKPMNLGKWAFLGGIVIATILGLFDFPYGWIAWVLVFMGVVIGALGWLQVETKPLLWASLVLVLLGQFAPNALIEVNWLLVVLYKITIVFVPVALITSIKLVLGKD